MYTAQFLDYLRFEKKYSGHTVLSYQNDLKDFESFLSSHNYTQIQSINHHIIRAFVVELSNLKLAPKSINRKISALKSYFKYLQKGGIVTSNPVNKINNLKVKKSLPVFVEEKKMNDLLSGDILLTKNTSAWEEERNKLILELLYGTGIRLSELISLKINDVNFSSQSIKVLGKRNKERLIPVYPDLLKSIENFINLTKVTLNSPVDLVFCLQNGKALYPMLVYKIVKSNLNLVTTQTKKSPHVLRHSFATNMLNNGADLNAIKNILGHSSLAATQVYTHNNFEQLKSIYKQAHPKG